MSEFEGMTGQTGQTGQSNISLNNIHIDTHIDTHNNIINIGATGYPNSVNEDKLSFDAYDEPSFDAYDEPSFNASFDASLNIRPPDKVNREQLMPPSTEDINENRYQNDIDLALKASTEDYFNKITEDSLEMSLRTDSLSNFCKKIHGLSFTPRDIQIRKYIEMILKDYFELKIDYHIVDSDIYDDLYKIINSFYMDPINKGRTITKITMEEDNIIRSILLKDDL